MRAQGATMQTAVHEKYRNSTPEQQSAIWAKGKRDKDTSNSLWKAFFRLFTKDKVTLP